MRVRLTRLGRLRTRLNLRAPLPRAFIEQVHLDFALPLQCGIMIVSHLLYMYVKWGPKTPTSFHSSSPSLCDNTSLQHGRGVKSRKKTFCVSGFSVGPKTCTSLTLTQHFSVVSTCSRNYSTLTRCFWFLSLWLFRRRCSACFAWTCSHHIERFGYDWFIQLTTV